MRRLWNNKLVLTITIFFSTLSLGTVMAYDPGYGVSVDIPFTFNAGTTKLPAGEYTIVRNSNQDSSMKISNADDSVAVMLLVADTSEPIHPQNPELVFDRIGNKDFLREVRMDEISYLFTVSPQEEQMKLTGKKSEMHKLSGTYLQEHKNGKMDVY